MKALVVNALGRGFDLEDVESHGREVLDVIKPTNGEVLWRRPRIRQVWDRGVSRNHGHPRATAIAALNELNKETSS